MHRRQRCADPQISRPRIIRVRKHQVRGQSASATVMATQIRGPSASASRVGLQLHCVQYTMLRPHTVIQAFLHSLYCGVQIWISFQIAENWYIGTSVRGWLVLQTILVALDPRMVRVRKCVCLADPQTVRVRKKICGSGSADIRVRSPHTSDRRCLSAYQEFGAKLFSLP